jgi:proteasome lid subunit RPN8/RPN11
MREGAGEGVVTGVRLTLEVQRSLLDDVLRRRHIEACGLLTGLLDAPGRWLVQGVHPLRNIADSPVYFEFAPEDILAVELAHPGEVIGAYHSHPAGPRAPSHVDRETMQRVNVEQGIPWVWLILCGPFAALEEQLTSQEIVRFPGERLLAYYHDPVRGLEPVSVHLGERAREA